MGPMFSLGVNRTGDVKLSVFDERIWKINMSSGQCLSLGSGSHGVRAVDTVSNRFIQAKIFNAEH